MLMIKSAKSNYIRLVNTAQLSIEEVKSTIEFYENISWLTLEKSNTLTNRLDKEI